MMIEKFFLSLFLASHCMAGGILDTLNIRLKNDYRVLFPIDSAIKLVKLQNAEGMWKEINYDRKRDMPIAHLRNVRKMAESYASFCEDSSTESEFQCGKIRKSVIAALKFWFMEKERFIGDNWWR